MFSRAPPLSRVKPVVSGKEKISLKATIGMTFAFLGSSSSFRLRQKFCFYVPTENLKKQEIKVISLTKDILRAKALF